MIFNYFGWVKWIETFRRNCRWFLDRLIIVFHVWGFNSLSGLVLKFDFGIKTSLIRLNRIHHGHILCVLLLWASRCKRLRELLVTFPEIIQFDCAALDIFRMILTVLKLEVYFWLIIYAWKRAPLWRVSGLSRFLLRLWFFCLLLALLIQDFLETMDLLLATRQIMAVRVGMRLIWFDHFEQVVVHHRLIHVVVLEISYVVWWVGHDRWQVSDWVLF